MSADSYQSFLSRKHAAERLDVSTRTIDRLRVAGELGWLRIGGLVRIDEASLAMYLERQRARHDEAALLSGARRVPLGRLPIPALDDAKERRRGAGVRRSDQG